MWAGQQCTPVAWATPKPVYDRRSGGHGESLRRTRGEAAGAQLGTDPAKRFMVNVGTISAPPSPPVSQTGGGKARRRLTAWRWDGVPVVVRGRESRPHGEGGQRISSDRNWKIRRTLVNTDEPWPDLDEAEARVLKIQTKLHQWAADDP